MDPRIAALIAAAEEQLAYLESYWGSDELENWDVQIDEHIDKLKAAVKSAREVE